MKMDYIPGHIHESFQKEHFFLVNYDFCWLNCGPKRFNEMSDSKDWDKTESIDLSKGDVIVVRFFKDTDQSNAYTYLERVIFSNGDVIEYKTESIISLALIVKNLYSQNNSKTFSLNNWLFNDVTKSFERNKKIESILY